MKQDVSNWLNSFHYKKLNKCITLSVSSGKGGVGKTSISLRLARELSESGYKVLVVDCDYNLSNTSIKLDLNLSSGFADYLTQNAEYQKYLVRVKDFWLISSSNGDEKVFDLGSKANLKIMKMITEAEKDFDFIILDCPAGIQKDVMSLIAMAQFQLVIVNPDRSSITDAYSVIKILNQRYQTSNICFLANKTQSDDQDHWVKSSLGSTCLKFLGLKIDYLGSIPYALASPNRFDHEFVFGEKNTVTKNFLKIRDNLIDRVLCQDSLIECKKSREKSACLYSGTIGGVNELY